MKLLHFAFKEDVLQSQTRFRAMLVWSKKGGEDVFILGITESHA